MTQSFSKKSSKPSFKRHYPYEVATSTNDAKLIAEAQNKNHKYQYLAECTIAGNVSIRPYDPIYLDNLPNGLSGYWTVISVTHRFGGSHGYYMLDLVVGTDVIGETNPNAPKAVPYRDVEGELNDQTLTVVDSVLEQFNLSPNETDLPEPYSNVGSAHVTSPATAIPNPTNDKFAVHPPSFSKVKRTTTWKATKGTKVIS
jgi:hypothetical protein